MGALQGGLGVCIIVASTAIGAIITMVTGAIPGGLLGAFVVVGTIVAALAVRPRAGRMLLPVPVLSYLVAALVSGVIYNRGTGSSTTALAIGAAQWIANGFFPMTLATAAAIVIVVTRWLLSRRQPHVTTSPAWSVPPVDGPIRRPPTLPRPPVSRDNLSDSGYPASYRSPSGVRDSGGVRNSGGNSGRNGPPTPGPVYPGSANPGSAGPGSSDSGSPSYRRPPGPQPPRTTTGLFARGVTNRRQRIASPGRPRSGGDTSGRVRHVRTLAICPTRVNENVVSAPCARASFVRPALSGQLCPGQLCPGQTAARCPTARPDTTRRAEHHTTPTPLWPQESPGEGSFMRMDVAPHEGVA